MPYRYSTTVGTARNEPLTTWQTPAAALCQNKPKVLLAPAGKVRATEGWRHESQNCDVYLLGCGVCTDNAEDHCEVWLVKPSAVPRQLGPAGAAPAPMQPKVGTQPKLGEQAKVGTQPNVGTRPKEVTQHNVGNLDENFEYFTEEDYVDEGYARTIDGTMRREETYRDERHLRTETRPVRRASAFPHVDSLNLARSAKRLKFSPSLDDARFEQEDDSRSCVSMSTVSSLTERPLTIDQAGPPVDPEFLEKVKHELNKDFGETTTMEYDRVSDGLIGRVIVNLQTPGRHLPGPSRAPKDHL